jgi:hypothetical protein
MTAATTSTANTESYDGSSWTEVNNLASARGYAGSISGSSVTASAIFGGTSDGGTPTDTAATEEWNFPAITSNILVEGQMWFNTPASALKTYGTAAGVPTATWASGGDLTSAGYAGAGFGTQTAALMVGGVSRTALNEEYNGSTWSEESDLNAGRTQYSGFGTTTAGIVVGGENAPGSANLASVESWNGSAWSEVGDIPATTRSMK